MGKFIYFLSILLLTSCASTSGTREVGAIKRPFYVTGTYKAGSNVTEPRPRESRFFRTDHAGFVVLENGAAYYIVARVLKHPPTNYQLRVQYENPQDKTRPFVTTGELRPTMDGILFRSPDVVWGIRNWGDYTIRIDLFTSPESMEPIDTLIQPVRSYVDTTTAEVRIFHRLR